MTTSTTNATTPIKIVRGEGGGSPSAGVQARVPPPHLGQSPLNERVEPIPREQPRRQASQKKS